MWLYFRSFFRILKEILKNNFLDLDSNKDELDKIKTLN